MKKLTIFLSSLFIVVVLFTACDKMEDIHSKYLQEGDISYAPKPLMVKAFSGRNRIMLTYYLFNASQVKQCVVEGEDGKTIKTQDIAPNIPVDSFNIIIDQLAEKSYLFKIYAVDKNDVKSIKAQVSGSSLGEIYQASIKNRAITSVAGGGVIDSIVVNWGPYGAGLLGVEINYMKKDGNAVKQIVPYQTTKTVIRGWQSVGDFTYRSLYLPDATAIDTFYSESKTVILPVNPI